MLSLNYQSQRDEDLCAFGTNNKQAFDPQDSLGFDENGTCTIGLSDPVRLTQFHEGREKCDFKNPRELSVKIRGDFDNNQILIDFSDNFGRTYYTEEEDDESRVGIRMQEWRRSRDLAIVGTNGSRHLISHEENAQLKMIWAAFLVAVCNVLIAQQAVDSNQFYQKKILRKRGGTA